MQKSKTAELPSHGKDLNNLFANRSTEKKENKDETYDPSKSPEENDLQSLKKINEHLRETTGMMLQELDRMTMVSTTLFNTSTKFSRTSTVLDSHQGQMSQSDKHMAILRRRQAQNYILIYGSFSFFICTVIYIVLKRLFYNKVNAALSLSIPAILFFVVLYFLFRNLIVRKLGIVGSLMLRPLKKKLD